VEENENVMFGDMRSEDEKLQFALELAFTEISKEKEVDEEEGKEQQQQIQ
jgi:hypothetical protein